MSQFHSVLERSQSVRARSEKAAVPETSSGTTKSPRFLARIHPRPDVVLVWSAATCAPLAGHSVSHSGRHPDTPKTAQFPT
eukprot:2167351-Pyramimonas_sp.AAC.1